MILPRPRRDGLPDLLYIFAPDDSGKQGSSGDWSSLIGIVTAIIGNVLISFALNTQRYAHIRLEREQNEAQESYKLGRQRQTQNQSYGTLQAQKADDRAQKNATASPSPHPPSQETTDTVNVDGERYGLRDTDALLHHQSPPASPHDSRPTTATAEKHPTPPSTTKKSYLRSPLWWTGILLMVTGEAGNFLAYGFAPASVVSPLGVVALISNCLIAPIMLREPFRPRDFLGVLVAVAGAVTVVLSAAGSNPKLGPGEIWELIRRWEFLAYVGVTAAATAVLMALSNRHIGERFIAVDLGLVALFGGYTALSTKGVASLLSYTLWRALGFPITYFLAAVLAGTAVLQIKYVNRALQRFDSTSVIPTQFVLFTISVIVGSAVLYRDFEKLGGNEVAVFVGGCGLTFVGVWFLTSGRRGGGGSRNEDKAQSGDEDLADEEMGIASKDQVSGTKTDRINLVDEDASPTDRPRTSSTLSTTSNPITPTDPDPQTAKAKSTPSLPTPRPPPITSTASTPLLPAHALTQTPHSPTSASKPPSATPSQPPPKRLSQSQISPRPTQLLQQKPSRSSLLLSDRVLPGPLTPPLSSGLSVVVADQRGRLRRGSSLRNNINTSVNGVSGVAGAAGPAGPASAEAGRIGRRNIAAGARARGGSAGSGSNSGGEEGDVSGEGSPSRVLGQRRPRMGRGATVEVASGPAEERARESEQASASRDEGGGGGGGIGKGKRRAAGLPRMR